MIFLPFQIYHLNINYLKEATIPAKMLLSSSVFSTLNWLIVNPISTGFVKLPIVGESNNTNAISSDLPIILHCLGW